MLLNKVKDTITKYGMLASGDHVLVAVSGGPDSVCLLSVLQAFSKELNLTLHIAHLDHMFRGRESADEALFVENIAKKLNIPATIEKFDVPAFCRERGLSSQAGAREARYAFLERVATAVGASRIALGHTASDQAETLLMRLMRGAGLSGLSSIPPVREKIIRPLIGTTREDVMDYLREAGLKFVSDPSNIKPIYTRNRVRMALIPLLRKFNPGIVTTLAETAALLRDENEAMEDLISRISSNVIIQEDDGLYIKRAEFDALPPAMKRRLVRKAADMIGLGLSFVQVDDAVGFMRSAQTGRAMQVVQGMVIERQYDRFLVHPGGETAGFCVQLSIPSITTASETGLVVEAKVLDAATSENRAASPFVMEGEPENYLWQAAFDYDKIRPPLFVRSRRPGDRFHPAGMKGRSKKLQDYFTDEKVPRLKRDSAPVVASEHDVLWVVGMRTDGRFLPGPGTEKVLVIGVRRVYESGNR